MEGWLSIAHGVIQISVRDTEVRKRDAKGYVNGSFVNSINFLGVVKS